MENTLSENHNLSAAALGCTDEHICLITPRVGLHHDVLAPWRQLCQAAALEGFDLQIASAYRSFQRQKTIWDEKLLGQRSVLDDSGCPLVLDDFSPLERVCKVLRWSALPGASRHHWGTDIDIYDRAAIGEHYQLQLTLDEYTSGGPFQPMVAWLTEYLYSQDNPGFILPYREDRGGVMPEPWHLSYWPVARQFQAHWSAELLLNYLRGDQLVQQETVEQHFDSLYASYIKNTISPSI